MASGVGGTISLNYYSVQGLNLESRAQFATEEDRQVFLDAIKNARAQEAEGNFNSTLEFPMPLNAEALGLLPGKLTEAGEVFADTLLDMMVILHQAGQVMKKVGKEVREAERDSQVDSLMDAAQKIRDAAMMAFAAGLASGIATMGSGIMGLVGSGAAMKKTAEAGKIVANPKGEITAMGSDPKTGYTTKANLSPHQQSQIQSLNSRADALRGMWQAGGQTLVGCRRDDQRRACSTPPRRRRRCGRSSRPRLRSTSTRRRTRTRSSRTCATSSRRCGRSWARSCRRRARSRARSGAEPLDLNQALGHLQKTLGSGPFVPDGDGRVRVAFADGLELFLIPAARGQAVAEVPLKPLPTAQGPREERLRSLLGRALAMMKSTEEVLALDEAQGRPVVWRRLELPEMTPAVLEEAVARLLDRAEWLAGEAAPVVARPAGPMLFFP